jgi:hypothetical protein
MINKLKLQLISGNVRILSSFSESIFTNLIALSSITVLTLLPWVDIAQKDVSGLETLDDLSRSTPSLVLKVISPSFCSEFDFFVSFRFIAKFWADSFKCIVCELFQTIRLDSLLICFNSRIMTIIQPILCLKSCCLYIHWFLYTLGLLAITYSNKTITIPTFKILKNPVFVHLML